MDLQDIMDNLTDRALKFAGYLNERSKFLLAALGLISVACVGFLDCLFSWELSLTVLYTIPIFFVSWFVGTRAGICIALFAFLVRSIDVVMNMPPYSSILFPVVNGLLWLCLLVGIIFLLAILKNALRREKALAKADSLTGLMNRRSFFEFSDIEIKRSNRYRHPFTVAYMDIDEFKTVNDIFGHSIGDVLLVSVAQIVQKNLRAIDTLARVGGDEFAVIMPESGFNEARVAIQRLHGVLQGYMRKKGWPVTFSIGVATFVTPPHNVEEMIKKADHLMYTAKRNGKNVIMYGVY